MVWPLRDVASQKNSFTMKEIDFNERIIVFKIVSCSVFPWFQTEICADVCGVKRNYNQNLSVYRVIFSN